MKILLIQPPFNPNLIGGGVLYMNEPLALESIGAAVAGQHDVRILDMRVEPDLESVLKDFNPDIAGITAYTTDVYVANNVLRKIKDFNRDILTVVGGHHATLLPEDFFNESVDVIVIGEGQDAFRELVDAFKKKKSFENIAGLAIYNKNTVKFTSKREPKKNLDDFPLPDRNLTKQFRNSYFRASWRPVASIMTSRGCPYRCNFCSVWKREDGLYRARSPENVVKELSLIEETFISVADDNFLQNVQRAMEIYKCVKESGMKKVFKLIGRSDLIVKHPEIIEKWKEIGMDMMFLGLESFRDSELKILNKTTTVKVNEAAINILHKNGVKVAGQFIIYPEYVKEDFEQLADYVAEHNLVHPIFSVLTPLPETDLYYQKKDQLLTRNYEMYDLVHCVLPTKMPREEYYKCYAELMLKCYSNGADKTDALVSNTLLKGLYLQLLNGYKLLD